MKTKLILISFLLFATIIIGFTTNTIANDDDDEDYEVGLDEGDEYVWICNTFDEQKMKESWGNHYDDVKIFEDIEEGKKMKWEITDVNDEDRMNSTRTRAIEDAYSVKYDIWLWTDEAKFGDADHEDESFSWFADPEDIETEKAIEEAYVPWVPINVEDYLDLMELYKWWNVDEDKLIYERFGSETRNWYNGEIHRKDVIVEMQFNEDGILSTYTVMTEDEEVVLEFSLEDPMVYIIPIIIAVILIIAALTIIYVVMRKKGIKLKDIKNKIRRKKKDEKIKD
jgi:hypothetical protein